MLKILQKADVSSFFSKPKPFYKRQISQFIDNITLRKIKISRLFEASASIGYVDPQKRIEIPNDFPDLINSFEVEPILKARLEKYGAKLADIKAINIAFPHKHPRLFPEYWNGAQSKAMVLQNSLSQTLPSVNWLLSTGLCETVKLGRSENQSSIHAITAKQAYVVDPDIQPEFAEQKQALGQNFFIIIDTCVEQGTTIANLMSYIHHNGGIVLAVVAGLGRLSQVRIDSPISLKGEFANNTRNTGRLAELAEAFANSAQLCGKDWTPDQCIERFEERLNRHNHTVFALTDGECGRLLNSTNGYLYRQEHFPSLITKLESMPLSSIP